MRPVLIAMVLAVGGVIAGGYMGSWHPAGDSLAVLRLPAVVVSLMLLVVAPLPRVLSWGLAILGMALIGNHIGHRLAPQAEETGAYRLYQQNLLRDRQEDEAWLAHVAGLAPDFLTLQELSSRNRGLLRRLAADYPHQHLCPMGDVLGEAVLSRHPVVEGSAFCSARDGLAGFQVDLPGGPVWVVSLHVSWPWPYGQAEQMAQILPYLEALKGPVVLAGDFNAVAWSHTVAHTAGAIRGTRGGPWVPTFRLPNLSLPIGIDHVISSGLAVRALAVQPSLGSDHNGLLAYLDWSKDAQD